jgi:hypothetical protein
LISLLMPRFTQKAGESVFSKMPERKGAKSRNSDPPGSGVASAPLAVLRDRLVVVASDRLGEAEVVCIDLKVPKGQH